VSTLSRRPPRAKGAERVVDEVDVIAQAADHAVAAGAAVETKRGIRRGKCVVRCVEIAEPICPVTSLTPDTMFERYGGLAFVSRFVLSFYDRALASARLTPFFAETDMQRLIEHQAKFISSVMGGPASYSDATLREAHAHLPIDNAAFDEMIDLFRQTLRDFDIAAGDVEAIIAALNRRRPHIVTA
jgi:hemoglobin